jgi:hypothetical protein
VSHYLVVMARPTGESQGEVLGAAETPVPVPTGQGRYLAAAMPTTGPADIGALLGLPAMGWAVWAYLRSRPKR